MIKILDTLYHDRDYARFFVLETIARVPYFGEAYYFCVIIIDFNIVGLGGPASTLLPQCRMMKDSKGHMAFASIWRIVLKYFAKQ